MRQNQAILLRPAYGIATHSKVRYFSVLPKQDDISFSYTCIVVIDGVIA